MNKTLISLVNVTKIINQTVVLDHINLNVEEGKTYGFIGPHGSGKTMLFRAIIGLTYITSGNIDKVSDLEMGAFLEPPGFLPEYTGFMNLKLLSGIKGKIIDNGIKDSMLRSGLDYNETKKLKAYSSDMKQKLAIAQAIMNSPDLLILDEPTEGLDNEGIKQIRKLVLQEKQKGTTILMASRNTYDINILCDYCYKMEHGRLFAQTLSLFL